MQIACVRFVVNCYTYNTLHLPQQHSCSGREFTRTTFEGHVMCSGTKCVPYMTYLPRILLPACPSPMTGQNAQVKEPLVKENSFY